jgi:tripartite-type tricarboxylate transporter receptor subunit TctC
VGRLRVPEEIAQGSFAASSSAWFGLFVPSATPKDIVDRLNREVRRIVTQPDVKAQLADFGADSRDWTPRQLVEFTDSEVKKWAMVTEVSGAKVE